MTQPRVSRQQAEMLEILNGTDYFMCFGKYTYELTLSEAADWLREVKGWHVCISWVTSDLYDCCAQSISDVLDCGVYDTHDLAISAGIDLILNQLTEQ